MILADSSIWIGHIRQRDVVLETLIEERQILVHPFVIGELALGSLRDRAGFIADLKDQPSVQVADPDEILGLIETKQLFGRGIGYVDVHLLASILLTPGAKLWSGDRRLQTVAIDLCIAFTPH